MTWEQMELLADAAAERVSRELLQDANMAAMGAAVGFSGDRSPLREIERALGLDDGMALPERAAQPEKNVLGEAMQQMAAAGAVRIESHGANRRTASGRAGRKDPPVPRRY